MSHSYRNTLTPFSTIVCGLPLSTLTATCSSGLLYIIAAILIISLDCPWNLEVVYLFVFLLIALTALTMMAGLNMMYARYHFNCASLTVSLLYSGSAALILFGLIMTSFQGLCRPTNAPSSSLFKSDNVGNYFIWFITAIGLAFQVVAHYYYG